MKNPTYSSWWDFFLFFFKNNLFFICLLKICLYLCTLIIN